MQDRSHRIREGEDSFELLFVSQVSMVMSFSVLTSGHRSFDLDTFSVYGVDSLTQVFLKLPQLYPGFLFFYCLALCNNHHHSLLYPLLSTFYF